MTLQSVQDRFTPLHDQILVKREPSPRMEGRIHLPDSAQLEAKGRGEVHQGIVMALGPGDRMKRGRFVERCTNCGQELPIDRAFMSEGPLCCGMAGHAVREGKRERCPIDLKIGDRIMFWFHAGLCDVTIEGEPFIVIHEEQHLVGVLEA